MPHPLLPRPARLALAAACLVLAAFPARAPAAEVLELQNLRDAPGRPAAPGQTAPEQTAPAESVPAAPGAARPSGNVVVVPAPRPPQSATVPETRDPQPATPPAVAVPLAPAQPAQPETPSAQAPEPATPPGTVVVVPSTPGAPEKEDSPPLTPESMLLTEPEPEKRDATLFTPENFLLTTPEPPDLPDLPDLKDKPAKPETTPSARAEKKPQEPAPRPEEKKPPEKKPEDKKPEKAEAPKKGDPLKIPEEAKKSGRLDFLEGCWVGTRPEYHTKRIVTERFCFGTDGTGKRFIEDPAYAGQCVGATRALMNQNGVLRMRSDKMYCSNTPENWGASEMTCQGEGEQTPCTWVFNDVGGARQSYTIRFVRE